METIAVYYKPVTAGGSYTGAYHKYIVYTDSEGNQQATRAGPEVGDGNSSAFIRSGLDFGNIDTQTGVYDETFIDYPQGSDTVRYSEVIKSGEDLSGDWQNITDAMDEIEQQEIGYDPLGPNSNTSVDGALGSSGLPLPSNDGPGSNWSPGSLLNPPSLPFPFNASPDWFKPGGAFYFPPISPLVFDLDGDGLDIILLAESSAYFDLNQNGFAENTAWIDDDDGFLAYDANTDGVINNLSELFGDSSTDAFTDLAAFDLNADDVIDAQDAVFADLQIWKDADSDGVTDAGEIFTLAALGITSISLATTAVNQPVNGNVIHSTSKVTFSNGETRAANDNYIVICMAA